MPVAGRTGVPDILGEPASPEEAGAADGSGSRRLEGASLGSGGAHTYGARERPAIAWRGPGFLPQGAGANFWKMGLGNGRVGWGRRGRVSRGVWHCKACEGQATRRCPEISMADVRASHGQGITVVDGDGFPGLDWALQRVASLSMFCRMGLFWVLLTPLGVLCVRLAGLCARAAWTPKG